MYLFVKACRETETEGFLENGLFLEHQKSDMSYQVIQKLLIYQTLGIKGLIQVIYLYPPPENWKGTTLISEFTSSNHQFSGDISVFRGVTFRSRGRGPRRKHIPKLLAAPKALDVQFLWVTLVVDKSRPTQTLVQKRLVFHVLDLFSFLFFWQKEHPPAKFGTVPQK